MKLLKGLVVLGLTGLILSSIMPKGRSETWIKNRSVKLSSKKGSCSGEQIKAPSGTNYILTAGHCLAVSEDGQNFTVTKEDGSKLSRRLIAEDKENDLLLIEGLPGMEGLDIAPHEYRNQHVRTFTHGHGKDTYKTEGVLIQEEQIEVMDSMISDEAGETACLARGAKYKVATINVVFFQIKACVLNIKAVSMTAMIVPGSSGGMIVNDMGALVGVVSAGGEGFGYIIPTKEIKRFIKGY